MRSRRSDLFEQKLLAEMTGDRVWDDVKHTVVELLPGFELSRLVSESMDLHRNLELRKREKCFVGVEAVAQKQLRSAS